MRKLASILSADILLLTLFVALVGVHVFRINVEATGYITPDSQFYLELANSLQQGKGFYIKHPKTNSQVFFSTWPVGYPILIYLLSQLSTASLFWASKLVNFLFLGLNFLLLRQISKKYSFVLASVFCSYTLLEIYSSTWSEAPFITGLLFLTYLICKPPLPEKENKTILLLFLTCLFLFLIRYVGVFSFGAIALLAVYNYYQNRTATAFKLTIVFFVLCVLMLAYLSMNNYLSGHYTGFNRLAAEHESAGEFLLMLGEALLNEILIIRKYRAPGDTLFMLTTLFQAAAIIYFLIKIDDKQDIKKHVQNSFSISCIAIGSLYLAAIIALRLISRFDDLDYRFLSPFSTLIFVSLLYALVKMPDKGKIRTVKLLCFAFFLLSLFVNLPKQYILNKLTGYFS
ncbi:hypothetical protein [Pontibacter beigongshangensis]|uniref:hypothetical protein n=1 Tax=Pontibacter beigongshangensis TaxID=2574733 RepID=UPI00164EFAE0|nr:hypothetical protein [Pontibacter beigongshangensis]